MPPRKTYILPPNPDCPIDGPIFMGSILMHPLKPYESLNDADRTDIKPPDRIYSTEKLEWQAKDSISAEVELGVFAQVLSALLGVGGDLATSFAGSDLTGLKIKRLVTEWFIPSSTYLDKCLRTTRVWQDIKKRRAPSLYIVSGRKLANGISAEEVKHRGHGASTKGGFNATAFGAPGDVGLKASVKTNEQHSITFEGSSDIVLAYQLRRIYYDKKTGAFTSNEHNKHVSLSRPNRGKDDSDDEGDEESEDDEITDIEVQGISKEDFGAAQLGPRAVIASGTDEEGIECDLVRSMPLSS